MRQGISFIAAYCYTSTHLFSLHLWVYSSLTFLKTVTVCRKNSSSAASCLNQSQQPPCETSRTHVVLLGTTMLVNLSYFSSQDLIAFLGSGISSSLESST
jgi:hypothetical protein